MDKGLCLKIAEQMDAHLQRELGQGVDPYRMLAEALYMRDVLLVCDAMPGSELASLARQFRAAAAPPKPAETAAGPRRHTEAATLATDALPAESAESLPAESLPAGETLPPGAQGPRDSRFSPSRFLNSLFGGASDFDGAPAAARPRTRHWLSPSRWLDK